jgi:hypothetical protein
MRKHFWVYGILFVVVSILVNFASVASAADKVQISIGAGDPGAVLYPTATAISNIINRDIPGYSSVAEQTGGARDNVSLLLNKKIEMAATSDSIVLEKYDPNSILYGFFGWNTDMEFVVLRDSKIEKIEDLKGKRISLGPVGSTTNTLAMKLLGFYGIGEKDFKGQFLGWEKGSDALLDGLLDATVYLGVWPVGSVQSLAMRKPIRVLGVDPAIVKKMGTGFTPYPIPASEILDKAVSVIAIPSSYWFRKDLPEDVVYNITKAVFSNIDYISKVHHAGKQFRIMRQKELEAIGVAAHPGVIKYAKEKNLW